MLHHDSCLTPTYSHKGYNNSSSFLLHNAIIKSVVYHVPLGQSSLFKKYILDPMRVIKTIVVMLCESNQGTIHCATPSPHV